MFPTSIGASGRSDADKISRTQYLADNQAQTRNINTMLQMLRCVAYPSVLQAIPTGVITYLVFDVDQLSVPPTPAIHTPSLLAIGSKFIAPADGYYEAEGQVSFIGVAAGTFVQIRVDINGATVAPVAATAVPAHPTATRIQVRKTMQLKYLDYVQFGIFHLAAGVQNTDPGNTWGSLTLLSRL